MAQALGNGLAGGKSRIVEEDSGGDRTDQMKFSSRYLPILAACLAVALSGCMSVPTQERTLTSDEHVFVVNSKEPQEMTLIHSGLSALKMRLEMIERAKKSIEVEVFIYDIDRTTRLLSQALVRKAKAGVKVRVLVDHSFPVFKLNRYYATEMIRNGVEVRYYNRASLLQIVTQQFRSHRKTVIIDDREAMTGGRNFAENYFDLSERYNFLDTDILVKGSVVQKVRESFDAFWNHKLAAKAEPTTAPVKPEYPEVSVNEKHRPETYETKLNRYKRESAKAQDFFEVSDEDRKLLAKIDNFVEAKAYENVTSTCYDTTYVADAPGVGGDTRAVFKQIREDVLKTEKQIDIESPYFILSKKGFMLVGELLSRGVTVNAQTNSLYSTDGTPSVAAFSLRVPVLTARGVNVWIYNGGSPKHAASTHIKEEVERWGVHSKRAVIDEKTILIGTFNVDPRSRNLNSEMVMICRDNPELAQATLADMERRRAQSRKLNKLGQPEDGKSLLWKASMSQKLQFFLLLPVANALYFLL